MGFLLSQSPANHGKPMSVNIGQARFNELNGGAPLGWKSRHPEVVDFDPIRGAEPISLVAIISTWFDADIIEASVKNCFAQGCERVLLIDNASPDDSIEIAEAAGASLAEYYKTDLYDEDLRIFTQNRLIKKLVERESEPLWIMTLDADEFPIGPRGVRIADYLASLPKHIRAVGSSAIDLYPKSPTEYVIGQHPAACMTHGVHRIGRYCPSKHWKHAILRYDGIFDMAQSRGNHFPAFAPLDRQEILEPDADCLIFHAPVRREEDARKRLSALCVLGTDGIPRCSGDDQVTGNNGSIKRWRSLDAIFAKRWHEVELPHTHVYGRSVTGVALYPWRRLVPSLAHLFGSEKKSIQLPILETV